MLLDKWWFDTNQDWEVLGDDFDSVSSYTIPDDTLHALGFHLSLLGYLQEGAPRFADIMDNPKFTIKPVGNNQLIIDSEDEKMKKHNKRAAKRKARLNNLCAPIWAPTASSTTLLLSYSRSAAPSSSRTRSPTLLSSRPIPVLSSSLVPALLSFIRTPAIGSPLLTPISRPRTPTALSSRLGYSTALLSYPETSTDLSSRPEPALAAEFLVVLLPLPGLSPAPPHLTSSALRTIKRALSDELLCRPLTSLVKPLYPFPTLIWLLEKSKYLQTFDTTFINSHLLTGNHAQEEVDLSFAEYRYPIIVKLNRLWQLQLLDHKPVCRIEAILLAAAIFWDPSFAPCHCHTMKLASKLGLRTRSIVSKVVKEKIGLVWANKTINQLDLLFWNNPE